MAAREHVWGKGGGGGVLYEGLETALSRLLCDLGGLSLLGGFRVLMTLSNSGHKYP